MNALLQGMLSVAEASALIQQGRPCCVAGDEALLRQLPRGLWIGGTTPYFMCEQGGVGTREHLFVTELPWVGKGPRVVAHDQRTLTRICLEAPEHGFTILLLPAFTVVHEAFAQHSPGYDEMYLRPLVGWVAGVHLDDLGKVPGRVVHGPSGRVLENAAVAMHVPVPADKLVHVDIVNLFQPGPGPSIEFAQPGFSATVARVDGVEVNLHDWMIRQQVNWQCPLVADYCGARVNVSIRSLNAEARRVDFFAPVFVGPMYRVATPIGDYAAALRDALDVQPTPGEVIFSCNSLLNYTYGRLRGRHTGAWLGPMAFGEIGYQLLNQSLVYLSLVDP